MHLPSVLHNLDPGQSVCFVQSVFEMENLNNLSSATISKSHLNVILISSFVCCTYALSRITMFSLWKCTLLVVINGNGIPHSAAKTTSIAATTPLSPFYEIFYNHTKHSVIFFIFIYNLRCLSTIYSVYLVVPLMLNFLSTLRQFVLALKVDLQDNNK